MSKLDILNRENFVNNLINLTENISDNKKSVSFAINGTWGCGKSFVLDMFENDLSKIQSEETETDRYFIIRYNCWKYDYYEEPLVAIVATMLDAIEKKTLILNGETGEKIKGVLKAVGTTLLSVANGAVKNTTGVDFSEAYKIVSSGISAGKEEYEKANEYDKYFGFKKALKSLHDVLNKLSKQYTMVFLIDELDRCLPEYAIKVLERLHHLTEDANNVITIISFDKNPLLKSIMHTFGFNNFKECEKYLKKFIQFEIKLNKGELSEKATEKFSNYLDLFDKCIIPYEDSIEDFFRAIFKNIDAREQEQLIDRVTLTHTLLFTDKKDYSFMCTELLIGVMFSYYQSKKKFCKWFDTFWGTIEGTLKDPPFAEFFNTKFSNIPTTKSHRVINTSSANGYILQNPNSIYSAIAYIWLQLIIGVGSSMPFLEISDDDIRRIWRDNVAELKRFIEMIKIIEN